MKSAYTSVQQEWTESNLWHIHVTPLVLVISTTASILAAVYCVYLVPFGLSFAFLAFSLGNQAVFQRIRFA